MGIQFEASDEQLKMPKSKKILIDGQEAGEATPSLRGDRLDWHVVIHTSCRGLFLVQGFGALPAAAVADGILRARKDLNHMFAALERIETSIGTSGKSAAEIETLFALKNERSGKELV